MAKKGCEPKLFFKTLTLLLHFDLRHCAMAHERKRLLLLIRDYSYLECECESRHQSGLWRHPHYAHCQQRQED